MVTSVLITQLLDFTPVGLLFFNFPLVKGARASAVDSRLQRDECEIPTRRPWKTYGTSFDLLPPVGCPPRHGTVVLLFPVLLYICRSILPSFYRNGGKTGETVLPLKCREGAFIAGR